MAFPLVLCLVILAAAQTYTPCNPTKSSCASDRGLPSSQYTVDFTRGASEDWEAVNNGAVTYSPLNGAAFTISRQGDAPTLQSKFYVFFGCVSFFLRAAPGTGIVSSAILESDDLDEIDWEWLGGSPNSVQTNYFGKGNTSSYDRGTFANVDDSQGVLHNYTIDWTSASTTWYIDGSAVRTLDFADAAGGNNYPQTPMQIKIGSWAGGDPSNSPGTIQWAGGPTNYGAGPFVMYLESITIASYNPASSYDYGDTSGDWQSIKIDGGRGSFGFSGIKAGLNATTNGNSSSVPTTSTSTLAPFGSLRPPPATRSPIYTPSSSPTSTSRVSGTLSTGTPGIPSKTTVPNISVASTSHSCAFLVALGFVAAAFGLC